MLVAEDWHGGVAGTKHFRNSLEHPPFRPYDVATFVLRIVPMLGDEQYAIDCQSIGAECERAGNVRKNWNIVLSHQIPTRVARGHLVGIQRNQF